MIAWIERLVVGCQSWFCRIMVPDIMFSRIFGVARIKCGQELMFKRSEIGAFAHKIIVVKHVTKEMPI